MNHKELGINLGSQLCGIQIGGQLTLSPTAAWVISSFCLKHQPLLLKQNKEIPHVSSHGRTAPQSSSETC